MHNISTSDIKSFVENFDKERSQLTTNNKEIIEKLKKLNIIVYGYIKRPHRTTNITQLSSYESLFVYLINKETLILLKENYPDIVIEGNKKNART